MKRLFFGMVLLLIGLAACVPVQVADDPASPPAAVTIVAAPGACVLTPIVAPTPPAQVPGYAQLDETSGLHVTGRMQVIDLPSYRLKVTGKVERPLELTYDNLRCLPKKEVRCTLVCPGFFEDTGTWAGVPLREVLDAAGLQQGVTRLRLVSADGYVSSVPIEVALADDSLLAYEWEGETLPMLHGFPVRAVFPTLDGDKWAKWLIEIEVR